MPFGCTGFRYLGISLASFAAVFVCLRRLLVHSLLPLALLQLHQGVHQRWQKHKFYHAIRRCCTDSQYPRPWSYQFLWFPLLCFPFHFPLDHFQQRGSHFSIGLSCTRVIPPRHWFSVRSCILYRVNRALGGSSDFLCLDSFSSYSFDSPELVLHLSNHHLRWVWWPKNASL